jgi:UDP-N-acetylmuramyl pentapeptide synthase
MTIPDGVRVVTFGAAAAAAAGGTERDGGGGGRPPDVSYDDVVSRALKGLSFTLRAAASDEKVAVSLPAPGAHMASNAAAACACAVAAGVSLEDAAKGVEAFESDDAARLRVVETPGSKLTIVDDAYNASPASVLAALRVMKDAMDQDQEYEEEEEKFEAKEKQEKEEPKAESEAKSKSKAKAKAKSKSKPKPQMKKPTKPRPPKVKKTKTFVLLGDMLELGEASKQHHEDVIEACLDAGFDKIGLAGPEFVEALRVFFPKRNVQSVVIAKDVEDLWDIIEGTQIIGPNARVLVKGSRGMKMDYIVDRLRSREGA